MIRKALAGLAAAIALTLIPTNPAHAGFQPELIDFCFGVDHPPFDIEDPPPGASVLLKADSLRRVPEGAIVTIVVSGPGGEQSGTGTVDGDGRVLVPIGINSFGDYTVTEATVTITNPDGTTTTQPIDEQVGQSFTVGGDDVPCSKDSLPPGELLEEPEEEPVPEPEEEETAGSTLPPTRERDPVSEESDDGFEFLPWGIFVIVGLPLIPWGLWIWLRQRDQCDWAAYYDDGGKRVVLRKARGTECCVYTVKVASTLWSFDYASRGRQMPDTLDGVEAAPEGRLRIFDYELDFSGLDIISWVSARSGPAGRLDWMQADTPANNPEPPTKNENYRWQFRQHEEPPDVAIHVNYWDGTDVSIVLESNCPDHKNTFVAQGNTSGWVQASQECSNREPGPECPVELTAMSDSSAVVYGDLSYDVDAFAGSDVDEMEGAGGLDVREVDGQTFFGSHVDSHDHVTRARETYDNTVTGNDATTFDGDRFSTAVHNMALLDSGAIVPARVWETTDRVSVDSTVEFTHNATIDASMQRTTCAGGGGCCGHGACKCAPKLKLSFAGGGAQIDCDGKKFNLDRSAFGLAALFAGIGTPIPWDLR